MHIPLYALFWGADFDGKGRIVPGMSEQQQIMNIRAVGIQMARVIVAHFFLCEIAGRAEHYKGSDRHGDVACAQ